MCTLTEKSLDDDVLCEEPDEDFFDTFFDGMAPVLETIGKSLNESGSDGSGGDQNSHQDSPAKQVFNLKRNSASSSVVSELLDGADRKSENSNAVSKSISINDSTSIEPVHVKKLSTNEENHIGKLNGVESSHVVQETVIYKEVDASQNSDFEIHEGSDINTENFNVHRCGNLAGQNLDGARISLSDERVVKCGENDSDNQYCDKDELRENCREDRKTEIPCVNICREDESEPSELNLYVSKQSCPEDSCKPKPKSSHLSSKRNESLTAVEKSKSSDFTIIYDLKEEGFSKIPPKISFTIKKQTKEKIAPEVHGEKEIRGSDKSRNEQTNTATDHSISVSDTKASGTKSERKDASVKQDIQSKKPTLDDLLSAGKRSKTLLKLKSKLVPAGRINDKWSFSSKPNDKTLKTSSTHHYKTHSESEEESRTKKPKGNNKSVNKAECLSRVFEHREAKKSRRYSEKTGQSIRSKKSPPRIRSQIYRRSYSRSPESYKWRSGDFRVGSPRWKKRKRTPTPPYRRTSRIKVYERYSKSRHRGRTFSPTESHRQSPSGSERSHVPSPTYSMKSLSRSLSQNSSRSNSMRSLSRSLSPPPKPVYHYSRSRKKSRSPIHYQSRLQRKSRSRKSKRHRSRSWTQSHSPSRSPYNNKKDARKPSARSRSRAQSRSRSHSRSRSPFINELNRLKEQWECEDRKKRACESESNSCSSHPPVPLWNMNPASIPDFSMGDVVSVSFQSVQVGMCNTLYQPPPPGECPVIPQPMNALSYTLPSSSSTSYFSQPEAFPTGCTVTQQDDYAMECEQHVPDAYLQTLAPQPVPPPMPTIPLSLPSAITPFRNKTKMKNANSPLSRQLVVMHSVLKSQGKPIVEMQTDSVPTEGQVVEAVRTHSVVAEGKLVGAVETNSAATMGKSVDAKQTDTAAAEVEAVSIEKKEPEVIDVTDDDDEKIDKLSKSELKVPIPDDSPPSDVKNSLILDSVFSESSISAVQGRRKKKKKNGKERKEKENKSQVIKECHEVIKMLSVGRFVLTADNSSGMHVGEREIPSGSNSVLSKRPKITYSLCKQLLDLKPNVEPTLKEFLSRDVSTNTSGELTIEVTTCTQDLIKRQDVSCQTETLHQDQQPQDMKHRVEELSEQLTKVKHERDQLAVLVHQLQKQNIPGHGLGVSRTSEEMHIHKRSNCVNQPITRGLDLPLSSPSASAMPTSVEDMINGDPLTEPICWDKGTSWPYASISDNVNTIDQHHSCTERWNTSPTILHPSESSTSNQRGLKSANKNSSREPLIAFEYNHSGVPTEVQTRISASTNHTFDPRMIGHTVVAMHNSLLSQCDQQLFRTSD